MDVHRANIVGFVTQCLKLIKTTSIKGCNFVQSCENPKVDLVKDNVYTKFGVSKSIRSQDIEKNLTSNKGHNYVANLWRMTIYNLNVDLVNDNVYTKIGLNKSIRSQDI